MRILDYINLLRSDINIKIHSLEVNKEQIEKQWKRLIEITKKHCK